MLIRSLKPVLSRIRPQSLEQALAHLAQHSSNRIIAGGTDLIPSMRQKFFEPEHVLDLRGIAALCGIKRQADGEVEIGALTTLRVIERSVVLRRHYPVLTEAAATVASPVLRNMGTIGGNICLDTRCLWYNHSLTWRKGCGFSSRKTETSVMWPPAVPSAGLRFPAKRPRLCSVCTPKSKS